MSPPFLLTITCTVILAGVMETLRIMLGKENVEVYSVDECFLDLSVQQRAHTSACPGDKTNG